MKDSVLLPVEPFWKVHVGSPDKSRNVKAWEADV